MEVRLRKREEERNEVENKLDQVNMSHKRYSCSHLNAELYMQIFFLSLKENMTKLLQIFDLII